jgi:hypothetical protein
LLVRMFRNSPNSSRNLSVVGFPVHSPEQQRRDESGSVCRSSDVESLDSAPGRP